MVLPLAVLPYLRNQVTISVSTRHLREILSGECVCVFLFLYFFFRIYRKRLFEDSPGPFIVLLISFGCNLESFGIKEDVPSLEESGLDEDVAGFITVVVIVIAVVAVAVIVVFVFSERNVL